MIEVLDNGDLRAGGGQPNQALVRVAQERRCQPQHDLLGMGVEGDHGRPGIARAAAWRSSRSRYRWPRCRPSKTPTATYSRPMSERSSSTPDTTSCGMPARAYWSRGSPVTSLALGCATAGRSASRAGAGAPRTSSPALSSRLATSPCRRGLTLVDQPTRGSLLHLRALCRLDLLTARSRGHLLVGQSGGGDRLRALRRPAAGARPARRAGGRGRRTASRSWAASRRKGPLRVRVSAPR
jgi:hypothetical protein